MTVRRAHPGDTADLSALRLALFPEHAPEANAADLRRMLASPDFALFLAFDGATAAGFAEVSLRRDYVNGCDTSPVVFLEGIYVAPAHRRRDLARGLVEAAQAWAIDLGCQEFASDALIDNAISHQMHAALGFEETERVVYFRKSLPRA